MDVKIHEMMLEKEKVKIGWNICIVKYDYIGILRYF